MSTHLWVNLMGEIVITLSVDDAEGLLSILPENDGFTQDLLKVIDEAKGVDNVEDQDPEGV